MKNYLTIYLQYINGNPKISINIKVNYSFVKMSYQMQSINVEHQLIEQNFDKKNVLGCVS